MGAGARASSLAPGAPARRDEDASDESGYLPGDPARLVDKRGARPVRAAVHGPDRARAGRAPCAPRAQHGADEHAPVDQDRRLPGGLCLLPAERALRHRAWRPRPCCRWPRCAPPPNAPRPPAPRASAWARPTAPRRRASLRSSRRWSPRCARWVLRPARRSACSSRSRPRAQGGRPGLLQPQPRYLRASSTARSSRTRTYQDRLDTLAAVRAAGIKVCCGGIVGMGESPGRPRRAAAHARQPARAPGERADQPAGQGARHAARGRRRTSIPSTSCAPSRWRACSCRAPTCACPPGARR